MQLQSETQWDFSQMHLGRVKLVKIAKNFLFKKEKVIKGNSTTKH